MELVRLILIFAVQLVALGGIQAHRRDDVKTFPDKTRKFDKVLDFVRTDVKRVSSMRETGDIGGGGGGSGEIEIPSSMVDELQNPIAKHNARKGMENMISRFRSLPGPAPLIGTPARASASVHVGRKREHRMVYLPYRNAHQVSNYRVPRPHVRVRRHRPRCY